MTWTTILAAFVWIIFFSQQHFMLTLQLLVVTIFRKEARQCRWLVKQATPPSSSSCWTTSVAPPLLTRLSSCFHLGSLIYASPGCFILPFSMVSRLWWKHVVATRTSVSFFFFPSSRISMTWMRFAVMPPIPAFDCCIKFMLISRYLPPINSELRAPHYRGLLPRLRIINFFEEFGKTWN